MTVAVDVFEDVPDNARLWIIAADRSLETEEQERIVDLLTSFFDRWQSHGRDVEARAAVLYDRFIVVSAFIPGSDVSGCGIDASVRELDEIADAVGFDRVPVLDILFRMRTEVRHVDRAAFAALAESGEVTENTIVFDTSLANAGAWRRGYFERPVSESWHADVFF